MGWQSAVVISALVGLFWVESVQGFPPPEDVDTDESIIAAAFSGFGQKLSPINNKRTGRGYPAAAAVVDSNHHNRAGFAPPPPPASPITLNNRIVDHRLAAGSAGVAIDDDIVVVSSAPAAAVGRPAPTHHVVAPPVVDAPAPPGDGSYSFTYASEESYRTETSDPAGNVVGEYQYWAGGEVPFAVKYAAGPDRGFVVLNREEVDQNLVRIAQQAPQAPLQLVAGVRAGPVDFYNEAPLVDPTTWERSRSYNFGYDSADGASRQEAADEAGSVTGSYQMLDARGLPFTVHYRAGAGIGFVVVNQAEVNARIAGDDVAAAKALAVANDPVGPTYANTISPVLSSSYDDYDDGSYNGVGDDYDYYDDLADRSYSFGYSGQVDDRREEANSEGYVKGSYSYLNNEGNQIKVEYIAGPEVGFVVQNEAELRASVVKATSDGAAKIAVNAAAGHVGSHEASHSGSSRRRMVVRKKARRKQHANALPITSSIESSYSQHIQSSSQARRAVINY